MGETNQPGRLAMMWRTVPPLRILKNKKFQVDFLLGGLSAMTSTHIMFPFAMRYKWISITQPQGCAEGPLGLLQFWRRTITTDPFSLWRGCLPKMLVFYPKQLFNLYFKDAIKTLLSTLLPGTWDRAQWIPPESLDNFLLYMATDVLVDTAFAVGPDMVTYPLQLLEQAAAVEELEQSKPDFGFCAFLSAPVTLVRRCAHVICKYGVFGLWSGFPAFFLGGIVERFAAHLASKIKYPPSMSAWLSQGRFIGIVGKVAAHPFILAGTRAAVAVGSAKGSHSPTGCVAVIREASAQGVLGLWQGAFFNCWYDSVLTCVFSWPFVKQTLMPMYAGTIIKLGGSMLKGAVFKVHDMLGN